MKAVEINLENSLFLSFFHFSSVPNSPNVGKAIAMVSASTEPISCRQSKISSPQLDFALYKMQFQSLQTIDLSRSLFGDQSQQASNMPTRVDDSSAMNATNILNQIQSEMDQMLDTDFTQVLKCFDSA